jgi:hypothetical protein
VHRTSKCTRKGILLAITPFGSRIEVKEAGDDSRSTGFNSKSRDERKGQSSVCMELL